MFLPILNQLARKGKSLKSLVSYLFVANIEFLIYLALVVSTLRQIEIEIENVHSVETNF